MDVFPWPFDETNYLSGLPCDLQRLTRAIMMKTLLYKIIDDLSKNHRYYDSDSSCSSSDSSSDSSCSSSDSSSDSSDDSYDSYERSKPKSKTTIRTIFAQHNIPMTMDIKRGCHNTSITLTLPEYVNIPPQLIIDLMLISNRNDRFRCGKLPKFNSLLRTYHIPYCIAEYRITRSRGAHRVKREALPLDTRSIS